MENVEAREIIIDARARLESRDPYNFCTRLDTSGDKKKSAGTATRNSFAQDGENRIKN